MLGVLTGWSLASRAAVVAGIVTLAAAISVAVKLASTPETATGALMVPVGDGIVISTPLPVSSHLPLMIDSGAVVRSVGDRGTPGVVIDEASLSLDLSDRPKGAATQPDLPDTKPNQLPQIAGFSTETVRLTRALVTITGPHGARVRLDDVNATITATRKGSRKLVATGRISDQPVAVDAAWSEEVTGAPQTPVKLTLRSPVLEVTLDGQFTSSDAPHFTGQADIQLPHLARFAKWSGLGRGIGQQIRSVSVSGPVEWSRNAMSFSKANVAVNANHATGALTIKHNTDRLSLDGTLGFQEIDFGRSWAAFTSTTKEDLQEPHILTVMDADLRLSASKIYAPALEVGRGAVSIALNKGQLQADIAELEIEGGIAGGQFALDFNRPVPRATFKSKLKGVDVGRVLASSLRRNALLGRCNLSFEATLTGRTLEDALTSMSGKGTFDLAEPGRLGLDIQALVHASRTASTVDWAAGGKGATPLDSLTARFRVLNGAVTIETFQARNSVAMFVGSGRFDVPGRLMDVNVATGPSGSTGEAPFTAQDVLEFRGTWDAPAISLVPAAKTKAQKSPPVRAN